jgi:hypothetical protein
MLRWAALRWATLRCAVLRPALQCRRCASRCRPAGPTLMTMALPANTAALMGFSTLWKGQFQGTIAPMTPMGTNSSLLLL